MRHTAKSSFDRSLNHGFAQSNNLSALQQTSKTERLNASFNPISGRTNSLRHNHDDCLNNEDVFAKTSSKLKNTNFSHHDDKGCLCQECHCKRHFCKFKVIKPDLSKNTVYQKSFYEQKAIPNIVNHDKQYDRLHGPHLDMNSISRLDYKVRNSDKIERPHPQDLLHSNGPCPNLSSYSSQFPGYKGENQYVKPTDKHARGEFPLRSKSTYAQTYIKKQAKEDDYTYFPDQLKTGYNWFGKTTYSNFYANPNPEYMAKKVKIIEKKEDNPDFQHQYETIYRHEYITKKNPLCPSKILLQTKNQGAFENAKHNFAENTDYKAISPEFHAISTSKHSYV